MIVVSDTTAITSLLQIGREDLLAQVYGEVFIPQAVQNELLAAHLSLPKYLNVKPIKNIADYHRLISVVDEGEAEAIVLAKEIGATELLIDEFEGRRVAIKEGLKIIGLLGVLLEAKKRGFINSVTLITTELENAASFHVSDAVKEIIFSAAGEL